MTPFNIFKQQNLAQNSRINGIPSNSPMYNSSANMLSARVINNIVQKGAIQDPSQAPSSGSQIQGGIIRGTQMIIGQSFSVDTDGTLHAARGYIANWSLQPSVLSSNNGNIVFDSTNNRLLIYNAGVPVIAIEG